MPRAIWKPQTRLVEPAPDALRRLTCFHTGPMRQICCLIETVDRSYITSMHSGGGPGAWGWGLALTLPPWCCPPWHGAVCGPRLERKHFWSLESNIILNSQSQLSGCIQDFQHHFDLSYPIRWRFKYSNKINSLIPWLQTSRKHFVCFGSLSDPFTSNINNNCYYFRALPVRG